MTIIETRLPEIEKVTLKSGSHDNFEEGACLLELSSWLAGEPFSDHPECVSPVLGAFGRSWNDSLDDEARQLLKPYAARFVGTKSTPEVETRRSWMACDWLVRTFTPAWLRLAGLDDDAVALESLVELTAPEQVDAALPTSNKARASANAARAAAAWDAARDAAGDAAGAAARVAARVAAWDAAWDAARDALAPTVLALQASARDLLDRMIAVRV